MQRQCKNSTSELPRQHWDPEDNSGLVMIHIKGCCRGGPEAYTQSSLRPGRAYPEKIVQQKINVLHGRVLLRSVFFQGKGWDAALSSNLLCIS